MPIFLLVALLFAGAVIVSGLVTRTLVSWLGKNHIMALPSGRGCHTVPTPVGGGWTLFGWGALVWAVSLNSEDMTGALVLAGITILALVSWIDDRKSVSAALRFLIQAAAVMVVLLSMDEGALVFGGYLSLWPDRMVTAFLWLWFVHLYNFMDGIDGLAGMETAFIGLGIAGIGMAVALPFPVILTAAAIAGAAIGFLWWNWSPASIFMGDVGSVTMGYLLGWLLIVMATHGYLLAALILPLYFIVDASYTLLSRMIRGEKVSQPHRSHFYQKASIANGSHAAIVKKVAIANIYLFAAAVQSVSSPLVGGVIAVVSVTVLMLYLYSLFRD